jgi:hypothetical protein
MLTPANLDWNANRPLTNAVVGVSVGMNKFVLGW